MFTGSYLTYIRQAWAYNARFTLEMHAPCMQAACLQPVCRLHVESVTLQWQKLKYIWLCLHIVANSETDTFVITGLLVTHLRTIY